MLSKKILVVTALILLTVKPQQCFKKQIETPTLSTTSTQFDATGSDFIEYSKIIPSYPTNLGFKGPKSLGVTKIDYMLEKIPFLSESGANF